MIKIHSYHLGRLQQGFPSYEVSGESWVVMISISTLVTHRATSASLPHEVSGESREVTIAIGTLGTPRVTSVSLSHEVSCESRAATIGKCTFSEAFVSLSASTSRDTGMK